MVKSTQCLLCFNNLVHIIGNERKKQMLQDVQVQLASSCSNKGQERRLVVCSGRPAITIPRAVWWQSPFAMLVLLSS